MKKMIKISIDFAIPILLTGGIILSGLFEQTITMCGVVKGLVLGKCDEGITSQGLKDVKVVAEYTWLGLGQFYLNRSVEDDIEILKELKTDWVYLGFRYKLPVPYSPFEEPDFFNEIEIKEAERRGYTLLQLKEAIEKLHQEMPDTLFTGGLGIEFFYSKDRDPITGEIINASKAWKMALDPQEYGFSISKEEFQCWWAKKMGWLAPDFDCSQYDYRKVKGYFPDINKEEVRELYLHKAMKLIDCGVDVVWIDLLHMQAIRFYEMSQDINHPAIGQTFESISKLVDEIRGYGFSKGKYVYIGSWAPLIRNDEDILIPPFTLPAYDYVVVSPSSKEVLSKKLYEEEWKKVFLMLREYMGENIVILMRFDLGYKNSPMHMFSQKLSPEEQKEFLRYIDTFLRKNNVLFSYPVFGLDMGPWEKGEEKVLSWEDICWETLTGQSGCGFPFYDSLAPEFQTYETIVELAENRAQGKPLVSIERPSNYLYVLDKEIFPLKMPIIIGKITVTADARDEDGISKVEFYIDDVLKFTDHDKPYSWLWNEFAIGRHEIKVVVHDDEGNKAQDEIDVIIFNLGGK